MKTQYYGVERSDDYLAHYGIKGMRWGVRRALARGDNKALARQHKKAAKKLAKLEARANTNNQLAKAKKWDKISSGARAAGRVGLGIAAAGTAYSGLPGNTALSYAPIKNFLTNRANNWNERQKFEIDRAAATGLGSPNEHVSRKAVHERNMARINELDSLGRHAQVIGAGTALGSYAASGAAKLRANYLRNRATGTGHDKAVAKANEFRNEMDKAFAGTKYANKPKKRRP